MEKVLLLSHGNLATEMKNTVEMIFGPTDIIVARGLQYDEDVKVYEDWISVFLAEHKEVLVFVDLFGGTPSLTITRVLTSVNNLESVEVVTGLNLPMILEILPVIENKHVSECKKLAMDSGQSGIIDLKKLAIIGN